MSRKFDVESYLATYPAALAFGPEPPEVVFDRYHVPEFVITSDGLRMDRERLIAHAAPARKRVLGIEVELLDFLADQERVAARYVLTARMRKGEPIVTEIAMFGRLGGDGRLVRAEQLTRQR